MNETQQVKSNIPTWISVQEACNLLNVKEKTIKNRCYKGDFIYKIEAKDNIKQIFIRYSSLSISKKLTTDLIIKNILKLLYGHEFRQTNTSML